MGLQPGSDKQDSVAMPPGIFSLACSLSTPIFVGVWGASAAGPDIDRGSDDRGA